MEMKQEAGGPRPWWKFGYVWLVLVGPVVVVAAGFVTLYLALRSPDPVVAEDYYRQGMELSRTRELGDANSLAPAIQARNHAATGVPAKGGLADKR